MMYELKLRTHKGKIFVADSFGNIIMKNLRSDQILSINRYEKKRINELSLNHAKTKGVKDVSPR